MKILKKKTQQKSIPVKRLSPDRKISPAKPNGTQFRVRKYQRNEQRIVLFSTVIIQLLH